MTGQRRISCCAGSSLDKLCVDKAYDTNWIRDLIWEQSAEAVIPFKADCKVPIPFDRDLYRQRKKVEQFIGRTEKSIRRIATRYNMTSDAVLAFIKLAATHLVRCVGVDCLEHRPPPQCSRLPSAGLRDNRAARSPASY